MDHLGLEETASPEDAIDALIRIFFRHAGEITLYAIGPMTNIAVARQREPRLVAKIKRLLFMGGTVEEPGNVTPAAESIIWFDAHAADIVIGSGLERTLLGLDVTSQAVLMPDRLERLAAKGLAAAVAARMLRALRGRRCPSSRPLHRGLSDRAFAVFGTHWQASGRLLGRGRIRTNGLCRGSGRALQVDDRCGCRRAVRPARVTPRAARVKETR